jgi:hypothetical protein
MKSFFTDIQRIRIWFGANSRVKVMLLFRLFKIIYCLFLDRECKLGNIPEKKIPHSGYFFNACCIYSFISIITVLALSALRSCRSAS